MTISRAVIVHLGRATALGEQARVRSWRLLLEAAGHEVEDIGVRRDHARLSRGAGVIDVVRGESVPEILAWDLAATERALRLLDPDVVVHITLRAHHRSLESDRWTTVLDFVDRLGISYRDRAEDARGLQSVGLRALGALHRRSEHRPRTVVTTAAGLSDADALGAVWIPNVMTIAGPAPSVAPTHDVVFFGNLSYAPNRTALARLGGLWPDVLARRPGTTALIGGAHPDGAIRDLALAHGWDLHGRYDHAVHFAGRGRVAVAPMVHTAGIQNKVLEAAAADRPQVLSPAAARGFAEPPPGMVASDNRAFVEAIVTILDDPPDDSGARRWLEANFSPRAWHSTVSELLGSAKRPSKPKTSPE